MDINPFEYNIKIYNATVLVKERRGYIQGVIQHRQSEPSVMTTTWRYDEIKDYLVDGYRWELWRRSGVFDMDWYLEFGGHFVDVDPIEDTLVTDAARTVNIICYGYRELLNRRYVLYPAASAYTRKYGAAEDVIVSFLRENIGDLAHNPARKSNGRILNFYVSASKGLGTYIQGEDSSFQKLSDVIDGICKTANLFIEVYWSAGQYRTAIRQGHAGVDRSTTPVNTDVGSPFRNTPVVFSQGAGNLKVVRKRILNSNKFTSVTALGAGIDSERKTYTANKSAPTDLIKREIVVNAINDQSSGLTYVANRGFASNKTVEFDFEIQQIKSSLYGKHYKCGDRVSIQYEGRHDVVIEAATLDFSSPDERVDTELVYWLGPAATGDYYG